VKILISLALMLIIHEIKGESPPKDSCHHSKTSFQCVRYVRNYDGDTVTFKIDNVHPLIGDNISVRIAGIDTAELRGKGPCEKEKAYEAKHFVEEKLKTAKRIEIQNAKRDKYFRILGEVVVDGIFLHHLLLEKKLAVLYTGKRKPKVDWCQIDQTKPK
jgi:endonuclease YncB( thermonuclease family)